VRELLHGWFNGDNCTPLQSGVEAHDTGSHGEQRVVQQPGEQRSNSAWNSEEAQERGRNLKAGAKQLSEQICSRDEQPAPKGSQSERDGSESPQPENRHITGGEQEAVPPARRFDWQLPGYSWRKPCPTCGGQPNLASFCTTCVNNGYIFDFTS
jgi:hypothetical protein